MSKVFLSIFLFLFLNACSGDNQDGDNVLVRFEGGVLTRKDVQAHLKGLKRSSQFKDKPEMLTPQFAFEHALNMEMIIAKALDEKLHLDPTVRDKLHGQMSDMFLKLMQDSLIKPIDKASISEEEVRAYYEKNLPHYTLEEQYNLHAFSVAADRAAEVADLVKTGTMTFAEAAAAHALEEQERAKSGRTGTRTLRRFQPSWQKVVAALPVGEVSGPLEIDGKTYLLLLESKSPPKIQSFEERKEYIKNDLLYSRYQEQWQMVYDELRGKYQVRLEEARLEAFYKDIGGTTSKPAKQKKEGQL